MHNRKLKKYIFFEKTNIGWRWTTHFNNFFLKIKTKKTRKKTFRLLNFVWKRNSLAYFTWTIRKQPPIKCIVVVYNDFSYSRYDCEFVSQQKLKWFHICKGLLQFLQFSVTHSIIAFWKSITKLYVAEISWIIMQLFPQRHPQNLRFSYL